MEKEYAVAQYISGNDIKILRKKMKISRKDFAKLAGVSVKTVEYWEGNDKEVSGPVVLMCRLLDENILLAERLLIPVQEYPLRILYMYKNQPCTVIDVDEAKQVVKIKNFTDKLAYRAFGSIENPDYGQFIEFVKSRCFPETRDKIKIELEALGLPFYDPISIMEKTAGKMAEDLFSVKIIRKAVSHD